MNYRYCVCVCVYVATNLANLLAPPIGEPHCFDVANWWPSIWSHRRSITRPTIEIFPYFHLANGQHQRRLSSLGRQSRRSRQSQAQLDINLVASSSWAGLVAAAAALASGTGKRVPLVELFQSSMAAVVVVAAWPCCSLRFKSWPAVASNSIWPNYLLSLRILPAFQYQ